MFYYIHALLPKKLLSLIMYRASRIQQPIIASAIIRIYIKITGASLAQASRKNIKDYKSLNDFFTRELEEGARVINDELNTIVSPVDGRVAQSDEIVHNQIFQIKGHTYSLTDLVGKDYASKYTSGQSMTIYLAPDDYHRIHAPENCTLKRAKYITGEYNSVSISLLDKISGLFAKNERVVYELSTDKHDFLLVMVGAVNVSSIETVAHGEIRTHLSSNAEYALKCKDEAYEKGEELARFNLGSTVVLIYPPNTVKFSLSEFKKRYWLGNKIGQ